METSIVKKLDKKTCKIWQYKKQFLRKKIGIIINGRKNTLHLNYR